MYFKRLLFGTVVTAILASTLLGARVTVLETSSAEERFQTHIVAKILEKMGHNVRFESDTTYNFAYYIIADNADSEDVFLLATSWNPLHDPKIKASGGEEKIVTFGDYIKNCAQGYLVDKKTADRYNIKYYNDLKDPKIAKLFDTNGNGKADLTGCPSGWGCYDVIEHQIKAFGMGDTVEHNSGNYSTTIAKTIENYNNAKPILYYTWSPYWVSGKLIPGEDVVFLQVKKSAHPSGKSTKLSNGVDYGFNVNSQQIAVNASVKKNHKDIAKLLEIIKLDVNDVSAQNTLMVNGQNSPADIDKHVTSWLKENKTKVDAWIKEAQAVK